jgi:hypothetical protein
VFWTHECGQPASFASSRKIHLHDQLVRTSRTRRFLPGCGHWHLQKIWLNYNKLNAADKLELFIEDSVTFISFKRRLFGNDMSSIIKPFII